MTQQMSLYKNCKYKWPQLCTRKMKTNSLDRYTLWFLWFLWWGCGVQGECECGCVRVGCACLFVSVWLWVLGCTFVTLVLGDAQTGLQGSLASQISRLEMLQVKWDHFQKGRKRIREPVRQTDRQTDTHTHTHHSQSVTHTYIHTHTNTPQSITYTYYSQTDR